MADTIQALHLLYRNRRAAGGLCIGLGVVAVVATPFAYVAAVGPSTSTYGNLPDAIQGTRLGLAIAAPIAALGIWELARGSKNEEEEIISLYAEKRVLPQRIRKKLRPELFLPIAKAAYR